MDTNNNTDVEAIVFAAVNVVDMCAFVLDGSLGSADLVGGDERDGSARWQLASIEFNALHGVCEALHQLRSSLAEARATF